MADLGPSVLEAIELHRLRVSGGWRYFECCTRCESSIGFTKHEARRRQVRVLVGLTVQIVKITILRWRASLVGACSPTCPTFLLPYRQYATPCLLALAGDYLEQDGSFRVSVLSSS